MDTAGRIALTVAAIAIIIQIVQGLKCYKCDYFEYYNAASKIWLVYSGDARCWNNRTVTSVDQVEKTSAGSGKLLYCIVFQARGLLEQGQQRIAIQRDIVVDHRVNLDGNCEATRKFTVIGDQCYCRKDLCNYFNKTTGSFLAIEY